MKISEPKGEDYAMWVKSGRKAGVKAVMNNNDDNDYDDDNNNDEKSEFPRSQRHDRALGESDRRFIV